jgi:hypothetical protein
MVAGIAVSCGRSYQEDEDVGEELHVDDFDSQGRGCISVLARCRMEAVE